MVENVKRTIKHNNLAAHILDSLWFGILQGIHPVLYIRRAPHHSSTALHIPVENEHLFRFKMNADSGLRVHRFRTPQCTYSDVR